MNLVHGLQEKLCLQESKGVGQMEFFWVALELTNHHQQAPDFFSVVRPGCKLARFFKIYIYEMYCTQVPSL